MITIFKCFIIGLCAILPGISGSVIAVSLGVYDRFLYILKNFNFKKNIFELLLMFIGLFCGIFLTSNLIIYIFKYKAIVYYCLIGVITSEIPFLIKKIHSCGKIKTIPLLLAFSFSLLLDLLNKKSVASTYSVFKLFLGGILFSFGKVFPGVSSSFFLLCLGIYEHIIVLITNPILLFRNIYFYIPFIIGSLFGFILFFKILIYLMENKYELIYSIILGFIISSTIILFPGFTLNLKNLIGTLLMICFFFIFTYIKKKKDK